MVSPAPVSISRRGQEEQRCEDGGDEETSHASDAEASRRQALPPMGVILGGRAGEARVKSGSRFRSFLPMNDLRAHLRRDRHAASGLGSG
jgi:hypothetical protein